MAVPFGWGGDSQLNYTWVHQETERFWRTASGRPTNAISFVVFAILTDGQGEMPVEIVVLELGTMQEVLRRQRVIELRDQLQQLGVVFGIRDCLFPVPGFYEV